MKTSNQDAKMTVCAHNKLVIEPCVACDIINYQNQKKYPAICQNCKKPWSVTHHCSTPEVNNKTNDSNKIESKNKVDVSHYDSEAIVRIGDYKLTLRKQTDEEIGKYPHWVKKKHKLICEYKDQKYTHFSDGVVIDILQALIEQSKEITELREKLLSQKGERSSQR